MSLCAEEHVRERQRKKFLMIQSVAPNVRHNRCVPVGHSVTCCKSFALMTSIRPDKVPPKSGMYVRPHFSQDNQIHACLQHWLYVVPSKLFFFFFAKPTLTFPNCCDVISSPLKKPQTFCLLSAGYDMLNGSEACQSRFYMHTVVTLGAYLEFLHVCVRPQVLRLNFVQI